MAPKDATKLRKKMKAGWKGGVKCSGPQAVNGAPVTKLSSVSTSSSDDKQTRDLTRLDA